jgi:hypothetical protein
MIQLQDAWTNFTMLHIWDVMKIEIGIERFLMRCMGGIIVRRIVICSVIRRGISSLLGSGGVNAFVVMRCVCLCLCLCCMYSGDCILDVLLLIFCSLLHIFSSNQS